MGAWAAAGGRGVRRGRPERGAERSGVMHGALSLEPGGVPEARLRVAAVALEREL